MSDLDAARSMLTMAEKDAKAIAGMQDTETFDDEVFGFHVQQAIEKALKAWITALGFEHPITHNLIALLTILEENGCDVAELWELARYNAFAVQFRYEEMGDQYQGVDRQEAISEIEGLIHQVRQVIAEADKAADEEVGCDSEA
jgi:HEPN domain-containing protein